MDSDADHSLLVGWSTEEADGTSTKDGGSSRTETLNSGPPVDIEFSFSVHKKLTTSDAMTPAVTPSSPSSDLDDVSVSSQKSMTLDQDDDYYYYRRDVTADNEANDDESVDHLSVLMGGDCTEDLDREAFLQAMNEADDSLREDCSRGKNFISESNLDLFQESIGELVPPNVISTKQNGPGQLFRESVNSQVTIDISEREAAFEPSTLDADISHLEVVSLKLKIAELQAELQVKEHNCATKYKSIIAHYSKKNAALEDANQDMRKQLRDMEQYIKLEKDETRRVQSMMQHKISELKKNNDKLENQVHILKRTNLRFNPVAFSRSNSFNAPETVQRRATIDNGLRGFHHTLCQDESQLTSSNKDITNNIQRHSSRWSNWIDNKLKFGPHRGRSGSDHGAGIGGDKKQLVHNTRNILRKKYENSIGHIENEKRPAISNVANFDDEEMKTSGNAKETNNIDTTANESFIRSSTVLVETFSPKPRSQKKGKKHHIRGFSLPDIFALDSSTNDDDERSFADGELWDGQDDTGDASSVASSVANSVAYSVISAQSLPVFRVWST
mmetsp:Transcript_14198/g.28897  ORF Transcript_14198/g.28897 Transcript_14198/m.28897 type:complete len:558 (+) Transcript_14198:223-1896(+)